MLTDQRDTLHSQMSANGEHIDKPTSSRLVEKEPVENTPFWLVGSEETGFFLTYNKYRITDTYETKEQALNRLITEPFKINAIVAYCIAETLSTP